ncbi:hypothetical protein MD484_g4415, partial [Candolleomyces efflorescens]
MPGRKPMPDDSSMHAFRIDTRLTVRGFIWTVKKKRTAATKSMPEPMPPADKGDSALDIEQPHAPSSAIIDRTTTTRQTDVQPPDFRIIAPLPRPTTWNDSVSTKRPRVRFEPPHPPPDSTHISHPPAHGKKKQDRSIFMTLPIAPTPKPTIWPPCTFEGHDETHLHILREDNPTYVDRRDLTMQLALRKLLLFGPFDLEGPGPARHGNHIWSFSSSDGSTLAGTWYRYTVTDQNVPSNLRPIEPVHVTRTGIERTDGSVAEMCSMDLHFPSKCRKRVTLDLSLLRTVTPASRAYRMWNGYFASTEAERPPSLCGTYHAQRAAEGFYSSVRCIALKRRSPIPELPGVHSGGTVPQTQHTEDSAERPYYLFRLSVEDTNTHDPTAPFKFTVWADIGVQPSTNGNVNHTIPSSNSPPPKLAPAPALAPTLALSSKLIACGTSSPEGIQLALNLDPKVEQLDDEQVDWEMGLVYYAMLAMQGKRFNVRS